MDYLPWSPDNQATENSTTNRELRPHFDAVALPHGDPHGHGDGVDEATKDLQQGETETLAVVPGGFTGEAGATPESKTTLTRKKKNTEKNKR